MSIHGRRVQIVDMSFLRGLLLLALVSLITSLSWGGSAPKDGSEGLLAYFVQVCNYTLATFVYVPLYTLSSSRAVHALESEMQLLRIGRTNLLAHALGAFAIRALLFSGVLVIMGLGSVCALARVQIPLDTYLTFGILTLGFQTLFFLAVGLVGLTVRLVMDSASLSALGAMAYGAFDYLLSMTPAMGNRSLWSGWFLTIVSFDDGPGSLAFQSVRLVSICLLLCVVAFLAIRRKEWFPRGADADEM